MSAAMRAVAAAHGVLDARELVLVTLDAGGGRIGHGEAAPLESYDGVSLGDVLAALSDCRAELASAGAADVTDPTARRELLAACGRRAVLPQALAGIDLAVHDLAGRLTGRPAWRLLGAPAPRPIALNWTVAAADRAGAAAEAAWARGNGFGIVKLKAGIGDDAGRVAAVRASGGAEMAIRLDANGAWSEEEAVRWLQVLAPAGIECCEEPVHGAEAIGRVASAVAVPVAIDESGRDPAALAARRCAAICLKVSRCGGIAGLLDAWRRARWLGYEVFLASTFDGPLGIAAALHAAAVIEPDRPCGLATLGLFADRPDPLDPVAGALLPPGGPGLGEGLLGWYG
jgi:L-alanine-DL-glutamate epimerase-like enolase superfamily enzyme